MKKNLWMVGLLSLLPLLTNADETAPTTGIDDSLKTAAEASITRAVTWLLGQQNERGAWSNENYPALTALPLWGLARSGRPESTNAIASATMLIVGSQSDSGAIYRHVEGQKGGGMPNYNTAIAIAALAELNDPRVVPVILKGREYIARSQHAGPEGDLFTGGMGYDSSTERAYADLSNSYIAYEAMFRTARFEEQRTEGRLVKLDWDAARAFIERCHNDPDFNPLSWASDDPSEKGGFAYRPDEYRKESGAYEKDGAVKFRSMPGMTYAGLLSYIYAGVDRDDPRVRATINWLTANWQLQVGNRNPELKGQPEEKEGLFYMYNVLTKGLQAYGKDLLTLSDGRRVNWREEMIRTLLALQQDEGSWVNTNGRYWEADKILVTSYALLAMETCLGR